jgi:hypothetical protein
MTKEKKSAHPTPMQAVGRIMRLLALFTPAERKRILAWINDEQGSEVQGGCKALGYSGLPSKVEVTAP